MRQAALPLPDMEPPRDALRRAFAVCPGSVRRLGFEKALEVGALRRCLVVMAGIQEKQRRRSMAQEGAPGDRYYEVQGPLRLTVIRVEAGGEVDLVCAHAHLRLTPAEALALGRNLVAAGTEAGHG